MNSKCYILVQYLFKAVSWIDDFAIASIINVISISILQNINKELDNVSIPTSNTVTLVLQKGCLRVYVKKVSIRWSGSIETFKCLPYSMFFTRIFQNFIPTRPFSNLTIFVSSPIYTPVSLFPGIG